MENLNLIEIFDSPNTANIKQKALTSQKNLEKYPTLFGHSDTTYVSLKKFANLLNGRTYWVDQKTYIKICKLYEKIQKIDEELQAVDWNIDMLNPDKHQEIQGLMNERKTLMEQMMQYSQK